MKHGPVLVRTEQLAAALLKESSCDMGVDSTTAKQQEGTGRLVAFVYISISRSAWNVDTAVVGNRDLWVVWKLGTRGCSVVVNIHDEADWVCVVLGRHQHVRYMASVKRHVSVAVVWTLENKCACAVGIDVLLGCMLGYTLSGGTVMRYSW